MRTIGFVISEKENEKRRAVTIMDLKRIKNKGYVYLEKGYGEILGTSDEEYVKLGCNVVSKEEVLNCDIICDPKIGDALYLKKLKNKIIFGWVHATQNYDITESILIGKNTAVAWEKFYEGNRHSFYRNNEIAGQASVLHAILCYGKIPNNTNVAILGNGNISKGALSAFNMLGAKVTVYTSKMEELFKKEMYNYDVIVNCILWDPTRKDHIIYKKDLKKFKPQTMIIDISCDSNGGIESCVPTTIENPTYTIDNVLHYAVDHTPALLYKDATNSISEELIKYIDILIEEKENENNILSEAIIIRDGVIIDNEINEVQNR